MIYADDGYSKKYPRELIKKLAEVFWSKPGNQKKYPILFGTYKEQWPHTKPHSTKHVRKKKLNEVKL